MRNSNNVRLGAVAIALASSAAAMHAQGTLVFVPVRTSEVMSQFHQERIGISHLTPAQRTALDAWLTRYTAEVWRAAASASGQPRTPAATLAATSHAAPRLDETPDGDTDESSIEDDVTVQGRRRPRAKQWVAPMTAPPGARVSATPGDGSYVRLADGTVWEVYLPDRPTTVVWRNGDYVTVSRSAGAGDYDHVLINGSARTRAFARFVEIAPTRRR